MKKVVFSGARPTGSLHLGHYFGALREYLKFQEEYETYFIISDWNMMTTKYRKEDLLQMKDNIVNMVIDLLSIGFDPAKTKIFLQSNIPEIASIYLLLQNIATTERLEQIPSTVQMAESSGNNSSSLGLFGFSVLVTSNVMGAQADYVPLGKDATDHLIFAQELIQDVNRLYDTDFRIPEWLNGSEKAIIGLDGNKKMSKSLNNSIFLCDSQEAVNSKISGINWTNSSGEDNVTLTYLKLFEIDEERLKIICEGIKNGEDMEDYAKNLLKTKINDFLEPIRKKREYYTSNTNLVEEILRKGNADVREKYAETLDKLKDGMKLYQTT